MKQETIKTNTPKYPGHQNFTTTLNFTGLTPHKQMSFSSMQWHDDAPSSPKEIIVLSLPLESTYVADCLCNCLWQRATVYDKSPHNIPRAFTLRLESQCSLNPSDNTT